MADRTTNKAIDVLCGEILKAVEVKTKAICSQMLKKNKADSLSSSSSDAGVATMAAADFYALTPEDKKQMYQSGIRLVVVIDE